MEAPRTMLNQNASSIFCSCPLSLAQREVKMALPRFPLERFWWPTCPAAAEHLATKQPACGDWRGSSQSLTELVGLSPPASPQLAPKPKPRLWLLSGRSLSTHLAHQLVWLPPERPAFKSPWSGSL